MKTVRLTVDLTIPEKHPRGCKYEGLLEVIRAGTETDTLSEVCETVESLQTMINEIEAMRNL